MKITNLSNATLILGFFDGIHLGHRKVIQSAVDFAKKNKSKTILLTFTASPAEYFNKGTDYIYPRETNYKIIKSMGTDIIIEEDFSRLIDITAEDYLKYITETYSPVAVFTGFNYTFGAKRTGTPEVLEANQEKYRYKYYCIEPVYHNGGIVSSTFIKDLIVKGDIDKADILLDSPFSIESTVITGAKMGRRLGFPTANMQYPDNIVKLPYGVYKVKVLKKTGILNWGVRPTLNGKEPLLEVHIPDFSGDLYNKTLMFKVLKKIRDEKTFESTGALTEQIKKDLAECLK